MLTLPCPSRGARSPPPCLAIRRTISTAPLFRKVSSAVIRGARLSGLLARVSWLATIRQQIGAPLAHQLAGGGRRLALRPGLLRGRAQPKASWRHFWGEKLRFQSRSAARQPVISTAPRIRKVLCSGGGDAGPDLRPPRLTSRGSLGGAVAGRRLMLHDSVELAAPDQAQREAARARRGGKLIRRSRYSCGGRL